MKNISPKYLIWLGFTITLILMTSVIILSTNQLEKTNHQMELIVSVSNVKTGLINQMYSSARERSLILLRMLTTNDPFEMDDEKNLMSYMASSFLKARNQLRDLSLAEEEIKLLNEQHRLTNIAAPMQIRVIELIINDESDKAKDLLINHALPRQNEVLKQLQLMLENQRLITENQLETAKKEHQHTINLITQIMIVTFFVIIIAILMVNWVVKKVLQGESALFSETAFQSITEGLITLDEQGKILYLNAVSESIIGKAQKDSINLPIESALLLRDDDTRKEVKNPFVSIYENHIKVTFKHHTLTNLSTGIAIAVDVSASPILKDNKLIGIVIILRDVNKERELQQQLIEQASTDTLTGLINRFEFERTLNLFLEHQQNLAKKGVEIHGTLIYLDLDQFKVVNDTCGHLAGDVLLQELGYLIQSNLRTTDKLARLGGDEFGIVLDSCPLAKGQDIAQHILEVIQNYRFQHEDKIFSVGASIGVVLIDDDILDMTDLMKKADAACYAAKDAGRNRVHTYYSDDNDLSEKAGQMHWVTRITESLENDKFVLYFQTIESLQRGEDENVVSCEILLRMLGNDNEVIPPGAFITSAERYNLIVKLDKWVINSLFKQIATHPELLNSFNRFSINLSGISLADDSLLVFILEALKKYQIPAKNICFEITETAAIGRLSVASHFINTLKEQGCFFALDDFGSGLSSFAYLKELPVDILKIDGIFIKDILVDPIDEAMVRSINEIGHIMGKKTVAEFVESMEICDRIKEIGIDFAQGYALSMPKPLSDLYDSK